MPVVQVLSDGKHVFSPEIQSHARTRRVPIASPFSLVTLARYFHIRPRGEIIRVIAPYP